MVNALCLAGNVMVGMIAPMDLMKVMIPALMCIVMPMLTSKSEESHVRNSDLRFRF